MIEFESVYLSSLKNNENNHFSLKLNQTWNFLYHPNKECLDDIFNLFNQTNQINDGSIIVDKIIINHLKNKQRNCFFRNYIAYVINLNEFNQDWKIKQLIKYFRNIYVNTFDEKYLNELLIMMNLIDYLDTEIKNLNLAQKFYLSLFIALLKKPKIIILYFNYAFFNNDQLVNFITSINNLNLNTNIICLTNDKFFYESQYFYDLTNIKYFSNDKITIYTKQNFEYKQEKLIDKLKSSVFIARILFFKNIWKYLIILMVCSFILLLGMNNAFKSMRTINYIFLFLSAFFAYCLYSFLIYDIFFKRKNFLINLNIYGFNNYFVIFTTIFLLIILSFIPIIIAFGILIAFYYTNITDNLNLKLVIYPILIFFGLIVISSFITSIKINTYYKAKSL